MATSEPWGKLESQRFFSEEDNSIVIYIYFFIIITAPTFLDFALAVVLLCYGV